MSTGALLNLLWLSTTFAGFVALGILELQHPQKKTWRLHCQRVASLFLASLLLFPCISSTDDSLSLDTLTSENREEFEIRTARSENGNPVHQLLRVFQLLHNCDLTASQVVTFQLRSVGLFTSDFHVRYEGSFAALSSGRSPPDLLPGLNFYLSLS